MKRLGIATILFLVLISGAFGLWVWWYLPAPFHDTTKRVASIRPLDQAIEVSSLAQSNIPLAPDLTTRPGEDWPGFLGPRGDATTPDCFSEAMSFAIRWHC